MAKRETMIPEPVVPDGPTRVTQDLPEPAGHAGTIPEQLAADLTDVEAPTSESQTGEDGPREAEQESPRESARRGGRRPYGELLEENAALQARVADLLAALGPLARLPDDPQKAGHDVLYRLTRQQATADIRCADIRRARLLLNF